MRLISKAALLYIFLGIFVFTIAGYFYQNLFQWYFDEKLKQEIVALLYVNQNRFLTGLAASPKVVTIEEVDIMKNLLNDTRLVDAVVVNKYGQVRWSRDPLMFGKRLEDYQNIHPLPTDAIARAYVTRSPKVLAFALEGKSYYEAAVPLLAQGDIRGVISLQVSRSETQAILQEGKKRFTIGAFAVVAAFVLAGILFISVWVVSPLVRFRETVDALSIASPVWPEARFRGDEIGEVSRALAMFLDKLRMAFARLEKDRKDVGELERIRWEHILNVLVKSGSVVILDGDNYVMASHNLASLMPKMESRSPRGAAHPLSLASQAAGLTGTSAAARLHLLDFVTSAELLQLINRALEKPGRFSEGTVFLDQKPYQARVMTIAAGHLQDQRTVVWLEEQK